MYGVFLPQYDSRAHFVFKCVYLCMKASKAIHEYSLSKSGWFLDMECLGVPFLF